MAILYGTQSNGETLPVLVDQFGNLLAKGLDGQPGEGVPTPYGADGQVLGIENGEPQWIDPPIPPTPAPTYDWINQPECTAYINQALEVIEPEDPIADAMALTSWCNPSFDENQGLVNQSTNPDGLVNLPAQLKINTPNSFGYVINIHAAMRGSGQRDKSYSNELTGFVAESDVNLVQYTGQGLIQGTVGEEMFFWGTQTFTFNRPVTSVTYTIQWDLERVNLRQIYFRGYEIIPAGTFALNRQMNIEKAIQSRLIHNDSAL